MHPLAFGDGLLVSAGHDGLVRVWEAATGAHIPGNEGPVRALCLDGNDLAADAVVRLWRLPTGELVGRTGIPQNPRASRRPPQRRRERGMAAWMRDR
ncbi:hypothetical protein [Actinoallomurus acaciae]|uniref:WD domain-containing protein, G-beta repeat-containing protein n=1 Tax=Actinoallomurus acaciae TaxID=502577 RepID=A0ABV5YU03_9ACTN